MIIKHFERLDDIPGTEKFYESLPVFATQEYAAYLKKTKNYNTVWFYGIISRNIKVLIPFTVRKKYVFTTGMFLTGVIPLDKNITVDIEREFLNSIVALIKKEKICDWIQQPANWALFRVVPSNSIYCEFGTYRINMVDKNENELYSKIARQHRKVITKAINNNILIKNGTELLEDCYKTLTASPSFSAHEFPSKIHLQILSDHLKHNLHIYVAYKNSIPLSSVIYCSDISCFYGLYSSRVNSASDEGTNHLLHWQAIKDAKLSGIQYYDFVGARISPAPNTKHDGIQRFKRHFGAELLKGFLWKMPISKVKYFVFNLLVRALFFIRFKKYKGDIIDQELKRNK
ncbi:MAG: peptidoglycan bridge formation glycyltransferase FemA/FemB family protein [Ignavibacterium sp.]|nr:peptidoglycan bridge formation glycyltransferase FemA/FemB family protein [Ignavibacterium sp.]